MVEEYVDLLRVVQAKLLMLGFKIERDTDFSASFYDGSEWRVVFEGERYMRPAFDLLLMLDQKDGKRKRFSVRLLMMVFNDDRAPSLDAQLSFLAKNKLRLFSIPPDYEGEYELREKV